MHQKCRGYTKPLPADFCPLWCCLSDLVKYLLKGAVRGEEEMEELDCEPILCGGHEAQASILGQQWCKWRHAALHSQQKQLADSHVQPAGWDSSHMSCSLSAPQTHTEILTPSTIVVQCHLRDLYELALCGANRYWRSFIRAINSTPLMITCSRRQIFGSSFIRMIYLPWKFHWHGCAKEKKYFTHVSVNDLEHRVNISMTCHRNLGHINDQEKVNYTWLLGQIVILLFVIVAKKKTLGWYKGKHTGLSICRPLLHQAQSIFKKMKHWNVNTEMNTVEM